MRILVVDDSKTMRLLVRRALVEAGCDAAITEAGNGTDAIAQALSGAIDLICCDVHLPDMTGFDVLRRIREAGSEIPFGFVTSDALPDTLTRAQCAGASFFINKPFKARDFAAALSVAQ